MTRTTRFVQNTVATGVYQLAAMIMGFVTPRLTMLYYGSAVNGLVVSITEFLTYFKLVEAGLAAAAIYSLYDPLARGDDARVSAIVSAARKFYNTTGFIFLGITAVFSAIYPFIVRVEEMSAGSVFLLSMVMGLSGALEFFTMARYRVLLTSDQKTYVVSIASTASLLVSTGLIALLSILRTDIVVVRLAAALTILVRSVILYVYVRRKYPGVNAYAKPDPTPLARRWDAMYQQITTAFHQSASTVLTTIITRSATLISVYATYHMVTIGLWGVLKTITTGVYSSFGNLIVTNQREKFQRAYRDFEYMYYSMSTVIYGVAAVLIIPFVKIYTHGVNDADYYQPLIALFVILEALTDHAKTPMYLMITAAGKFRETRHHNTLQIACAVVLGTALGLLLGIPGILAGIIVSNILRTTLQLLYVPRAITGVPAREAVWRIVRMFVTVGLIGLPVFVLLPWLTTLARWILAAVALSVYALLVTAGMGWLFDREAMLSLLSRVLYVLRLKKKPTHAQE